MFYATNADAAAPAAEALISDAGFDAVRTGTLARTDVGHQEPKATCTAKNSTTTMPSPRSGGFAARCRRNRRP